MEGSQALGSQQTGCSSCVGSLQSLSSPVAFFSKVEQLICAIRLSLGLSRVDCEATHTHILSSQPLWLKMTPWGPGIHT